MDLRIQRTRRSIVDAFLSLRAEKPIEKITVKELAERAFINKATFYMHYKDIYDLQEQLENEAVERVIRDIPHPDYLIEVPREGVKEMTRAMIEQEALLGLLFSGGRENIMVERLDKHLRQFIFEKYPMVQENLRFSVILTAMIYGSYMAYINHRRADSEELIDIICEIDECLHGLITGKNERDSRMYKTDVR